MIPGRRGWDCGPSTQIADAVSGVGTAVAPCLPSLAVACLLLCLWDLRPVDQSPFICEHIELEHVALEISHGNNLLLLWFLASGGLPGMRSLSCHLKESKDIIVCIPCGLTSLAQSVKNLPAMQETWV